MRRILCIFLIVLGLFLLVTGAGRALRRGGIPAASPEVSVSPMIPPPPVEALPPAAGEWRVRRQEGQNISPGEGLGRRGPFRILSSTPSQVVLEFVLPDYSLVEETDEEGRVWSALQVEGTPLRNCIGQPQVPWFSLPYGTLPGAEVSVEWRAEGVEVRAAAWPRPGTGPRLSSEPRDSSTTPLSLPDGYGMSSPNGLPEAAWLSPVYQIRDIQGTTVSLTPCQYDFQEGVYRIATRGTLVLRSTATEQPQVDAQQDFARLQRGFFVNGEDFEAAESAPVGTLGVLIPDAWRDSEVLALYLQWRRSLGWEVLSACYPQETGEGRDAVLQQIRSWYEQEGASHLLILGDLRQIPPYQFSTDTFSYQTPYQTLCTDVPYSLLAGENDLSYADLFLGRIPVHDQAALETYLAGLVRYEQGEDARDEWTRRAIYLGSGEEADCWPYQGQTDWANVARQKNGMESAGILDSSTDFQDPSEDRNLNCPGALQVAVNDGASLLLYLGHGHCLGFVTTNYDSRYAMNLAPSGRAPFWMTPVCDAGRLDHAMAEGGDACTDSYYSLGQSLFENENGDFAAVGAVMGGGSTYWDPPIVQLDSFGESVAGSRGAERLSTTGAYAARGMVESVAFCENYRTAYQEAKQEGTTMSNGAYTAKDGIYHAWSIVFLGDPSALLRVGPQSALEVAYQWREGKLHCQVAGLPGEDGENQPVPQSIVALEQNGEVCGGRTDEEGVVVLSPASLKVALWGEIRVLDGSAPLRNFRIPLSDGNGDGVVTNQEMHQWLALWRQEYAGAEESTEAQALLTAAVRQWQDGVPPREAVSGGEESAGEIPASRLWKVKLPLTDSTLETAAGAGLPLLSRDDESFVVRANSPELDWLAAKNIQPLETASFSPERPARSVAEIQERMEEMSRRGWPDFRLSRLGSTASGEPLLALRVSLREEEDAAADTTPLPQLALCAGLSGEDADSVETLMAFLEAIWDARNGKGDIALRELLDRCVLWVAPLLNPDGYETGTPQNARGVELEWGFPVDKGTLAQGAALGWEELWRHPSFRGTLSLPSQPEQLALARWMMLRHPSVLVLLRQGDTSISCAEGASLALGDAWSKKAGLPTPVTLAQRYPSTGRFSQWVDEYLEIPSLELSLDAQARQEAAALLRTLLEVVEEGQGGTVRDGETREPVPYARISRQEDGLSVRADHEGNYFLPLAAESLVFQAEGWEEGTSPDLTASSLPLLLPMPERARFLPGVPESHSFLGREIPAYSLARLSLDAGGLLEEPETETGALCRQGEGFLDFLWLTAPAWKAPLTLTVTPAKDAPGEIALEATLFTQTQGEQSRRHVLLAPVRESLALSWKTGWNLFSVPMEGVLVDELEADAWFCWRQGAFQPFTGRLLTPGEGYVAHFPAAGSKTLYGGGTDQGERSLEAGWHLLGPLSPRFPSKDSPAYTMGAEGWRSLLPDTRMLTPGGVYFRRLAKPGLVAP
ncbi:MAG: C25 family cysteine peptidase [Oligosphaeraceae bacterium]